MKIAVMASSNTSSNVGNAFYYEGIKYALRTISDEMVIYDSQFMPINAYRLKGRYVENIYDYFQEVEGVDFVILAGPILDKDFGKTFGRTIERAKSAEKKIFLFSAGGRTYSKEEIEHCRAVLSRTKPDIFMSRDAEAFKHYGDLALHSYDGICFAFFAPLYHPGYDTPAMEQYIASVFDFGPEPDLTEIDEYSLKDMEMLEHLTIKNYRAKAFLKNMKFVCQRNLPDQVNGIKIIRACHRPMRSKHLVFFKKNIISSFSFQPYLNLYRNAALTLTDRLHAAVVALAYGRPARLVLSSNRTRLLERAHCSEVMHRVFKADYQELEKERFAMIGWLSQTMKKYVL